MAMRRRCLTKLSSRSSTPSPAAASAVSNTAQQRRMTSNFVVHRQHRDSIGRMTNNFYPCTYRISFSSTSTSSSVDNNETKPKKEDENEEATADTTPPPPKEKKSLRETVEEMQGKDTDDNQDEKSSSSSTVGWDANDVIDKAFNMFSSFRTELSNTWEELINSGKPKDINKRIHDPMRVPKASSNGGEGGEVDDEAANKYDGPSSLMVVDEKLGAWDRMQKRLAEAPIIKGILGASHQVFEKTGAAKAKRKLDDIKEDAAEAWETSQNPWVYRLSSVWDTVTAESEFAIAVRELRRLDPDFTLVEFKESVIENTIPEIMKSFLEGRTKELKPWLGEAVYNRLAAEIRVRKQEGLIIDPNILGIENSEILAAEIDEVNKGSPIILLHFMCQQINCVRKKDGTIVEGGEDEIRANSYIVAFQREYNDEEGELTW
eukprot:CAMPEP_0195509032 /NCGR_PEP_ID=MMETSP0794_2-20130614/2077_1 /TAXON_ID=515487 /ORGANISM="Stephanopyxis turris, Strain CCMP 815" /LENGTH=432 /DNA_ID=CAMNT_0040636143 /DNA_START=110 /DNA_END=1405 /DNA_ORIENTATION=+